jgi:hypothetical protein
MGQPRSKARGYFGAIISRSFGPWVGLLATTAFQAAS